MGTGEQQARCGDCRLWGRNFYPRLPGWAPNVTCCADAVMDLPASFIPNRQTMQADEGEGCICFEPTLAAPRDRSNHAGRDA